MPDCSAMKIAIGGTLPRAALELIASAIFDEGLGPDWNDRFADETEVIAHIEAVAAESRPLALYDDDCPGGMAEDLEALCRELGLAYHRCDDGHYSYSPMHAAWRPGLEQPVELFGTIDSGPCVPLYELSEAHREAVADVIRRYEVFLACVPPLTLAETDAPATAVAEGQE